jgi:hypothetical protein
MMLFWGTVNIPSLNLVVAVTTACTVIVSWAGITQEEESIPHAIAKMIAREVHRLGFIDCLTSDLPYGGSPPADVTAAKIPVVGDSSCPSVGCSK